MELTERQRGRWFAEEAQWRQTYRHTTDSDEDMEQKIQEKRAEFVLDCLKLNKEQRIKDEQNLEREDDLADYKLLRHEEEVLERGELQDESQAITF